MYQQKVLKYKDQAIFEKISMPSIDRISKIYQRNGACFMFVNKGEFSIRTPSEFLTVDTANGMLAKCFNYFFEANARQKSEYVTVEIMGIYLLQPIIEELFQFDMSNHDTVVDYNAKQVPINGLLENFRQSLEILLDNPTLADEATIGLKLKEFILLISKTQSDVSPLEFISALFRTNATTFKSTIVNNLYSDMSVDEYAYLANMSLSTFKRRFKEVFGESPQKYLRIKKLEMAAEKILDEHVRISEVAFDVGFDSIATFNRTFKNYFKVSPSEYRVQNNSLN